MNQRERPCEPRPSALPLEVNAELARRTTNEPVTPSPTTSSHLNRDERLQNTRDVQPHEPAGTKAGAPHRYTSPPHQESTPNQHGDPPRTKVTLPILGSSYISLEQTTHQRNDNLEMPTRSYTTSF